jgi:hypothetical protein
MSLLSSSAAQKLSNSFALFLSWLSKSLLLSSTHCVNVARDKFTGLKTVYFPGPTSTRCAVNFSSCIRHRRRFASSNQQKKNKKLCLQCKGTVTGLHSADIFLSNSAKFTLLRTLIQLLHLSDFLTSRGSGTGSTQPRDHNWGATWKK